MLSKWRVQLVIHEQITAAFYWLLDRHLPSTPWRVLVPVYPNGIHEGGGELVLKSDECGWSMHWDQPAVRDLGMAFWGARIPRQTRRRRSLGPEEKNADDIVSFVLLPAGWRQSRKRQRQGQGQGGVSLTEGRPTGKGGERHRTQDLTRKTVQYHRRDFAARTVRVCVYIHHLKAY